jgi:hypothetical protein
MAHWAKVEDGVVTQVNVLRMILLKVILKDIQALGLRLPITHTAESITA